MSYEVSFAFLNRLEAIQPFSEPKAWSLFRIAALVEAVAWTILISGILIRHYQLPYYNYAVPIAGQIHGTVFLVYFGVLIATYSSLNWSRKKFVLAAICGVPPYGTLVFEQWAVHKRQAESRSAQFYSIMLVTANSLS